MPTLQNGAGFYCKRAVSIGLFVIFGILVTSVSDVFAQTATPVSLNTFRTSTFSLQYPAGWQVAAHGNNETYIGPGAAPVCAQPGALITVLGQEPPNKTADTLFDDYQVANSYLTGIEARSDMGDLGRTAVFEGPCTDGSTRDLRVSVYIAFGSGYRLTTYAPRAQFKGWDAVFKQIAASFTPVIPGANGQNGQPVHAPDHTPPTLLIHIFRGNVYMANVADVPGAPLTHDADVITNARRYAEARIAPDGKHVAFVAMPGGDLYIAPIAKDAAATKLPVQIAAPYPLAWSPDGTQIAYIAASDGKLTLNTITISDGTARPIGMLPGTACAPAKSDDPAALTWIADLNAADANGNRLLLEWSAANTILVSDDCTGTAVSKIDLAAGKAASLAILSNAALSPDKSQLAGIANGKLALVDLTSGQLKPLAVSAGQVIWGSDGGTLFYTTRTIKTPLLLNTATVGVPAFQSAVYDLSIHSYLVGSGQDNTLYTGTGFAVGSMSPSPDGSGLVFTIIQDDSAFIAALGKQTPTFSSDDLMLARPVAQTYWLPFAASSVPTLLIDTLQAQFGPSGSTAVIGVPVKPHAGATNIPGG